MTDDRMNPTDATLWEIKRDPELRTTIVALATLAETPDWDALTATVRRAIDTTPRLRQRVVEGTLGLGRPRWVDCEVDLPFHLRRVTVPQPTSGALLELIRPLAGEDFDVDRPLWQVFAVDGLADGRSALVLKVSHALTDGIGGISLLRAFADPVTGSGTESEPPAKTGPARPKTGPRRTIRPTDLNPLTQAANAARMVRSAGRLLAPAGEPLSPLFTDRSLSRWLGTTELRFDRLVAAAHRAGGTVNDAFVTISLGALAEYHRELGATAGPLRVTMPVSFRRESDPEAGNQWTPSRFVAAIDPDAHPFDSLNELRGTLHRSSHEPAIGISQILVAGIQELPAGLTTSVVAGMVKGSDVVLTDVPGPADPITIADVAVEALHPFAPTGGAALNIGLLTYSGVAHFGFTVDPAAVADPERLLTIFDRRAADFVRRRRRRVPATAAGAAAGAAAGPAADPVDQTSDPSKTQRLSALDTSFLRMESVRTPMHMGSLLVLDGTPLMNDDGELDLAAIRSRIAARLSQVPRLTRKVREIPFELARPVWVDDPSFDIDEHVRMITLPAPGTREQLLERCELLQMRLLPRSRPLFELWFIVGLDPATFGPNRIALVEKLHHAMLDGMSGVELVSVFFDTESTPLGDEDPAPGRAAPGRSEPSGATLAIEAVAEQLREPRHLLRLAGDLVETPRASGSQLAAASAAVSDLVRPLLGARTTASRRTLGRRRLLVPLSVPLDSVHDAGAALGGTVNDVVLAAVAAGFGALYAHRGETPPHPFTAMVPVSTRLAGLEGQPGNHVSAMMIELPLGDDPVTGLSFIAEAVAERKERHYPEGTEVLLHAADHVAPPALHLLSRLVAHQPFADVVVTNMPGPRRPLSFGGATIEEMIPIVPLGANLPVSIAVISYAGSLTVALHADDEACPDVKILADGIVRGFDDLIRAAQDDAARNPDSSPPPTDPPPRTESARQRKDR